MGVNYLFYHNRIKKINQAICLSAIAGMILGINTNLSAQQSDNENGTWIRFDQIDFGRGVNNFYVRTASETGSASIELRLGNSDGQVIGTCKIEKTEGWQSYKTISCLVPHVKGKQTIVLRFVGGEGNLMNINWFSFKENPYTIKNSTD